MIQKPLGLIHERKATKMTRLRETLLCAICDILGSQKLYHRCKLHQHHSDIEVTIRPLSFLKGKMRRVFEITLRITEKIRDAAGKIKHVFHTFQIEFPVEMTLVTLR